MPLVFCIAFNVTLICRGLSLTDLPSWDTHGAQCVYLFDVIGYVYAYGFDKGWRFLFLNSNKLSRTRSSWEPSFTERFSRRSEIESRTS